jgi:hypothetical protein
VDSEEEWRAIITSTDNGKKEKGAEMEITEIILAKVSRLCQLSNHSRGFLSRPRIFNSLWISFGHETSSYDTKCFFIVFVKFKISNNFKQNVDETHSKQP